MNRSKQKVVVISGAGMSAESGLKTFRDADGLWEGHRVEDVATPEAWERDPEMVLDFYNQRRRQLQTAEPNAGHRALAQLEEKFSVEIITQNVDDLHERAGSTRVLHLHGELGLARSSVDEQLLYPLEGRDIRRGDLCEKGSQLRPHIVWFGEMVPAMEKAEPIVRKAEILVVVGTSLVVYPAASLVSLAPTGCRRLWMNPQMAESGSLLGFEMRETTAAVGLPILVEELMNGLFTPETEGGKP